VAAVPISSQTRIKKLMEDQFLIESKFSWIRCPVLSSERWKIQDDSKLLWGFPWPIIF
jgi:hypothetical protein